MAKASRGRLTEEQRAFVVQRLACWDSPAEAAAALTEEHGVTISPQACQGYDPTKRAGRQLASKWVELFHETRKALISHLEDHIPEANKAVRVRHLATAARSFKGRRNYVGMADMLERIAKEVGNVHSNKREISGKDGGPIQFADLSDEQLDARLARIMAAMGDGGDDERGGE